MSSSHTQVVPIWLPLLLLLPPILFLVMKQLEILKQKYKFLLPPGPPKLPFIGNFHQLGGLTHVSLWELSKKYGPVMHLRLGSVPALVVSSAEVARHVLKTHDLDSCSRPSFAGTRRLSYNHLDVVFSPHGDYWKEVRKLTVANLLSPKRVESSGPIREEEVASLMDSISQSRSEVVDLSAKMITLTANNLCRIAFGKSFRGSSTENAGLEELVQEATCMLESFCASDFFPGVGWIVDRISGFHKRLEKSFHGLDALYQRVIDQHNDPKGLKDEDNIVDTLLAMGSDQKDSAEAPFQLTQDHIKAILMNVFIAGVDNSAITIIWAMTELSKNTKVMKKVQDEIRTLIGNKGRVSGSDLDKFPYFKMVVKETLRLHPPGVLLVPKQTVSHFKINGYDVCPKTLVLVNAWAIGRDGNSWEKSEEFYPERFEESRVDYKGRDFELLPFGAGRRVCPGIGFAMATVELALANLLYCYDWKLPDGMSEEDVSMEEAPGIAVRKKLPLKLVPVSYKWHEP